MNPRINAFWAATRPNQRGWRQLVLSGACLLVAISVWIVLTSTEDSSDEIRYRRAVRIMRLAGKLQGICQRLPHALAKPLDHELTKPFDVYNKLEMKLLTSGFLTNISIVVTDAPMVLSTNLKGNLDRISRRLHGAVPNSDFLPFTLERDFQNTQATVKITCPARDVSALRKALENY